MKPMKVSAGQAENYYYSADPTFSLDQQRFAGRGAEALGLAGQAVSGEAFSSLLRGYAPDGTHLVGKANHADNAATDTPLTAPKSFSIMMQFDPRLQEALIRAGEATAHSLEERGLIVGRQTVNGVTEEVDGKGILAAFAHSANRDGEPHAHVHIVAMNAVQRPDGSWSTLENSKIFEHQKETFQIFTTELAAETAKLGYSVEQVKTAAGMSFEIQGVSQTERNLFSSRHNSIRDAEAYRAELRERLPHATDTQIDNMVQRQTRQEKNHSLTAEEIRGSIAERLELAGTSTEAMLARVAQAEPGQRLTAGQIVSAAIQDLTTTESVVSGKQIMAAAEKLAVGHAGRAELSAAFAEARAGLIAYGNDQFTTVEMRDMQLGMARSILDGKGQFEAVKSTVEAKAVTDSFLSQGGLLTPGQKTAAETIMASEDKMLLIQGVAGAGKSTMLKLVNDTISQDVRIIGLAPTGAAVAALQNSSGIESQTVALFLQKELEPPQPGQRTLIVVDEAGMLETRQWAGLMKQAERLGAQIVAVGDTEQLNSIGAGKEFSDWQRHGLAETVRMDESVRQRTDYAKEVAQAAQAGRFEEAFAIMAEAGKLHITSREQATTAIAERIAAGEDAVFSAMKNSTRTDIINAVDSLRGDQAGVTIRAAMPVATNESDRRYFGSYKEGNIVLVNGEIEGFKKGERLTIQGGSHENNSVTFLREDGSQASLNMFEHGRSLSQYSISEQTFHVGDQIAYTKNINTKEGTELSIRNSIRGTVKSINEQAGTFVVENEAGKITQHRDGDFITRADALTVYKTQGLSEQTAIAAIFTDDRASANAAYVALTRMKEGMELYTDDPAALAKALAAENKTSTLDYESAEVEAMKSERIQLDSSDQSDMVLAEKLASMRSHEQAQEQETGQAPGSSQRQEQEMSLSL